MLILFGPAIGGLVATPFIDKKIRRKAASLIVNVPLSFLTGGWMSAVIMDPANFRIPATDTWILDIVTHILEKLPILNYIPDYLRLPILLGMVVLVIVFFPD